MTAGKQLNYLIAQKFMKLEAWPEQNPWKPQKLFKPKRVLPGEPIKPIEAPDYSGKIAPAWRVLEELNRISPVSLRSDITGQWFVTCGTLTESAPTAPLAICLLALRSLEKPALPDDEY